jgi:hypothetical protein
MMIDSIDGESMMTLVLPRGTLLKKGTPKRKLYWIPDSTLSREENLRLANIEY